MSKCYNALPTRGSFFISIAEEFESAGIQNKAFQDAVLLRVTVI